MAHCSLLSSIMLSLLSRSLIRSPTRQFSACVNITHAKPEASQLFDDAITRHVTWDSGPFDTAVESTQADPSFLMGRLLVAGMQMIGTGVPFSSDSISSEMRAAEQLVKQQKHSEDELLHLNAMKHLEKGEFDRATMVWEQILHHNPSDMMALKFSHDAYFYLGESRSIRDSVARVVAHYPSSNPFHGFVAGMYAFGLEECGEYKEAEKYGQLSIDCNPSDAWGTHALAHVYEMTGQTRKGQQLLATNVHFWTPAAGLAAHLYWHWALYVLDEGGSDAALGIFDKEIAMRSESGEPLDMVDASSLLFRLELAGVNVGDRWQRVKELWAKHIDYHITSFNDAHIAMCIAGSEDKQLIHTHRQSMSQYMGEATNNKQDNLRIMRNVGWCEAVYSYRDRNYQRAFDLLLPVRHSFWQLGGSHAQRDIFTQILLHSAIAINTPFSRNVARLVLDERDQLRMNSGLSATLHTTLKNAASTSVV